MQAASSKAGKRLLDYLDIHYYYAADTSANDAAAKALRLRMTRSLWGIFSSSFTRLVLIFFRSSQTLRTPTNLTSARPFRPSGTSQTPIRSGSSRACSSSSSSTTPGRNSLSRNGAPPMIPTLPVVSSRSTSSVSTGVRVLTAPPTGPLRTKRDRSDWHSGSSEGASSRSFGLPYTRLTGRPLAQKRHLLWKQERAGQHGQQRRGCPRCLRQHDRRQEAYAGHRQQGRLSCQPRHFEHSRWNVLHAPLRWCSWCC
jgi:hypothetical protein